MRSTILPRSPALRLMRSGAHVNIPSNFFCLISSTISLKIGRWPASLAECDSCFLVTISRFSAVAIFSISLIWLSMERTCLSSCSVLFLAYKQYLTLTGLATLAACPNGLCNVFSICLRNDATPPRSLGGLRRQAVGNSASQGTCFKLRYLTDLHFCGIVLLITEYFEDLTLVQSAQDKVENR